MKIIIFLIISVVTLLILLSFVIVWRYGKMRWILKIEQLRLMEELRERAEKGRRLTGKRE
jgi:hypothetical protein